MCLINDVDLIFVVERHWFTYKPAIPKNERTPHCAGAKIQVRTNTVENGQGYKITPTDSIVVLWR